MDSKALRRRLERVLRDRTLDAMARIGVRGTVDIATCPDDENLDFVENGGICQGERS